MGKNIVFWGGRGGDHASHIRLFRRPERWTEDLELRSLGVVAYQDKPGMGSPLDDHGKTDIV
jgi:hypothetical protein